MTKIAIWCRHENDNIIGIGLDKIKKEEKPSDMKVRFMREEDNNVR